MTKSIRETKSRKVVAKSPAYGCRTWGFFVVRRVVQNLKICMYKTYKICIKRFPIFKKMIHNYCVCPKIFVILHDFCKILCKKSIR